MPFRFPVTFHCTSALTFSRFIFRVCLEMRAVHMSPGLYSSLCELVISISPDILSHSLPLWIFLDLVGTFSFVYASQTPNTRASIFGSETSFYMLISGRQRSATPCIACLQSCDSDIQTGGQEINSSRGRAGGKSARMPLDWVLLLVEDINRN